MQSKAYISIVLPDLWSPMPIYEIYGHFDFAPTISANIYFKIFLAILFKSIFHNYSFDKDLLLLAA